MPDLRSRLKQLRGAVAVADAPNAAVPEWLARLERLRLLSRERMGKNRSSAPLPGTEIGPGLMHIQARVSGIKLRLAGLDLPETLQAPWAPERCVDRSSLLLFDTETSGLSGGVGLKVFMLGMLSWQADTWVLDQYLLSRPEGEAALVAAWMKACRPGICLVSYNGKRFDIPAMRTLQILHACGELPEHLIHWDLLYPVRRAHRHEWPNCRLVTAESQLLGKQRHQDLPGSEAPRAWRDFLMRGETGDLLRVLAHNRSDLESLLGILKKLLQDPRTAGKQQTARKTTQGRQVDQNDRQEAQRQIPIDLRLASSRV